MLKIQKVYGLEVLDSRGNPTVCAQVQLSSGVAAAAAVVSAVSLEPQAVSRLITIADARAKLRSFFMIFTSISSYHANAFQLTWKTDCPVFSPVRCMHERIC